MDSISNIGVAGLAVMGENLVLNMENKGLNVSVYNRTISKVDHFLEQGDIVIDGGNSHYRDTERRVLQLEEKGLRFFGAGVSGGEEAALKGPSIMVGGFFPAWNEVEPILVPISARTEDGSYCCSWMGGGGSGHFVKMIHNGIEYGDMQLTCKIYNSFSLEKLKYEEGD